MAQAVMVAEPQALTAAATTMVAESLAAVNINEDVHKKNRIQVSNTKKPLFFYLNLAKTTYGRAKRYIKQYNDVELSALGMAIPTVVTISEMLKANGTVVEKKVLTSTVGSKDENKGRFVQKAKIEIVLEKSDKSPTSADATTKCVLKTETKAVSDERKEKGESNIESENAEKKEG